MPTRLYFTDSAPAVTPTPHSQWSGSSPFNYGGLNLVAANTAFAEKSKGRGSGVTVQIPAVSLVSPPLAIGTNFATTDTFKIVARSRENTTANDASSCVSIRIVDSAGAPKAVLYTENIIGSGNVSEWTTVLRNQKFPRGAADNTGTALQANYTTVANDRLEITLGARIGGDFGICYVEIGDLTSSTDLVHNATSTTAGRPWAEFSNTFAFYVPPGTTKSKSGGTFNEHNIKLRSGGVWQAHTVKNRSGGTFS